MKLPELNAEIAAVCDMRAKSVLAVQKETFRRLREILEKGERVIVPGFGTFSTRQKAAADGGEATSSVRFKLHAEDETGKASNEERKSKRQAKKRQKSGDAENTSDEEVAAAPAAEPQ